MSADAADLEGLVRDLRKIPALMVPKLRGVVAKSALNTKKLMVADVRKSSHFRGKTAPGLDASISYDLTISGDVIEAEIGPTPGGGGSLAGIAYFGTSRPGGGTVRNPEDAMLEEAPNFYEYAFQATEGLL